MGATIFSCMRPSFRLLHRMHDYAHNSIRSSCTRTRMLQLSARTTIATALVLLLSIMLASSGPVRAFTRTSLRILVPGRQSVRMASTKLDKSTADSQWKDILNAKEVRCCTCRNVCLPLCKEVRRTCGPDCTILRGHQLVFQKHPQG